MVRDGASWRRDREPAAALETQRVRFPSSTEDQQEHCQAKRQGGWGSGFNPVRFSALITSSSLQQNLAEIVSVVVRHVLVFGEC